MRANRTTVADWWRAAKKAWVEAGVVKPLSATLSFSPSMERVAARAALVQISDDASTKLVGSPFSSPQDKQRALREFGTGLANGLEQVATVLSDQTRLSHDLRLKAGEIRQLQGRTTAKTLTELFAAAQRLVPLADQTRLTPIGSQELMTAREQLVMLKDTFSDASEHIAKYFTPNLSDKAQQLIVMLAHLAKELGPDDRMGRLIQYEIQFIEKESSDYDGNASIAAELERAARIVSIRCETLNMQGQISRRVHPMGADFFLQGSGRE